jgi:hypothetical protein
MAYEQIPTVKLAHPGSDEGFMIVNAADYRADQPQWMYDQGLAYDPAVWKPYVEPTRRAPVEEEHDVPRETPAAHAAPRGTSHTGPAASRTSTHTPEPPASEKK